MVRKAGIDVEAAEGELARRARGQLAGYLSVHERGRPWVIYKAAITFDGRMTLPGEKWISGDESRRLVHELRAEIDAVAVGMGTVRADAPRLDARDVGATKQPRRLAFGHGPSELEVRSGPLEEELRALAAEGVQSLLLEGGPTLAGAFLDADLVDKLLVFTAPLLAGGDGPTLLPRLGSGGASTQRTLSHLSARAVGEDVLLEAYVHEP